MVDRSLESSIESLAADRGITICFVDLEGADGLWLPEERTILLSRELSGRQAADVLQHELSHVDIEDGHAALDASMHRRLGRTHWAVAGTAAMSLALLFGIRAQLHAKPAADSHPTPPVAVAPSHTPDRAGNNQPAPTTSPATRVVLINGEVRTQTVTVTPPLPSGAGAAASSQPADGSGTTKPAGSSTPTRTNAPLGSPTGTPTVGTATETTGTPTTTPPPDTSSPAPAISGGVGGGTARR